MRHGLMTYEGPGAPIDREWPQHPVRDRPVLGLGVEWQLIEASMASLGAFVSLAGRQLLLHPTFGDRYLGLPWTVSCAVDDREFLEEVLADPLVVPVVVCTQRRSGLPASDRWPRSFEPLVASNRPYAKVSRGLYRGTDVQLEGSPSLWGSSVRIVNGEFECSDDAGRRPSELAHDDEVRAVLARVEREFDDYQRSLRAARSLPSTATLDRPGDLDGDPITPVTGSDEVLRRAFMDLATEAPSDAVFEPASPSWSGERDIVRLEWGDVLWMVVEIREFDISTFWCMVDEACVAGPFESLDDVLDACLPVGGGVRLWPQRRDVSPSIMKDWLARHPIVAEPYAFEFDDEFWAAIRVEDGVRLVPGLLEANDPTGRHDFYWVEDQMELEWLVDVAWETGAVISFAYHEELLRHGDVYYLVTWRDSDRSVRRLGRFECRLEAAITASTISEACHYLAIGEQFADDDVDDDVDDDEVDDDED